MGLKNDMAMQKDSVTLLKEQRQGAAKPLLWIGMASMFMAFAGLASGYIVSRSSLLERENWLEFALPNYFYYSTAVILLSSLSMVFALQAARKNDSNKLTTALTITLVLGLTFGVLQVLGWQSLYAGGIFFTGEGSNPAGSWVYAITSFHLAHMIGGIVTLLVTLIKASMGKYANGAILGVELAAIFWHFLDLVWICLFLFLLFIR